MTIMNPTQRCLSILIELKTARIRIRKNAIQAVKQAHDLAQQFAVLPDSERIIIQNNVDSTLSKTLISLSGYFAEYAINENDSEWITAALILHIIENFQTDARENIRRLALIKFSANKINANISHIVEDLSLLTSNSVSVLLNDFMGKPDDENILATFGIKAAVIDGEFIFTPIE
jgi:hypothetical protein